MPIQITTKTVTTEGPNNFYRPTGPYALIGQWGYGRMDQLTPTHGLATFHLASCTAVVLHCASTGRTALTHSPNFLYMNTFAPIFHWVSGGDGTMTERTAAAMWINMGVPPPSPYVLEVEVAVIRGFEYAEPRKAANFGHAGWMADFHEMCEKLRKKCNIHVTISDLQEYAASGALLVDKGNARVTHLKRRGVSPQTIGGSAIVRLVEDPGVSEHPYGQAAKQRDLFMGNLLGYRYQPECQDLHLQYDVSHYCAAIPPIPEARELLRSKLAKEPVSSQAAIVRAYGSSKDWTSDRGSMLHKLFENCAQLGMTCEACSRPGTKACSTCRGAWYCSAEHQKQDWAAHKAWCKAHKIKKEE
jgi:hypothetical protein